MPNPESGRKSLSGLKRGDCAKIARRYGLSVQHVHQVALGERKGSEKLERAIERQRELRRRQDAEAEQTATPNAA